MTDSVPPADLVAQMVRSVRFRMALSAHRCPECQHKLVYLHSIPSNLPIDGTVWACPTPTCRFVSFREPPRFGG